MTLFAIAAGIAILGYGTLLCLWLVCALYMAGFFGWPKRWTSR